MPAGRSPRARCRPGVELGEAGQPGGADAGQQREQADRRRPAAALGSRARASISAVASASTQRWRRGSRGGCGVILSATVRGRPRRGIAGRPRAAAAAAARRRARGATREASARRAAAVGTASSAERSPPPRPAAQDQSVGAGPARSQVQAVLAGEAPHERRDDLRRAAAARPARGPRPRRRRPGAATAARPAAGVSAGRRRPAPAPGAPRRPAAPGPRAARRCRTRSARRPSRPAPPRGTAPGRRLLAGGSPAASSAPAEPAGPADRRSHRQQRRPDGQRLPRLAVRPVTTPGVRAGTSTMALAVSTSTTAGRRRRRHRRRPATRDLGLGQALAEVRQQELASTCTRASARPVLPLQRADGVQDPVDAGQVVRAPASAPGRDVEPG